MSIIFSIPVNYNRHLDLSERRLIFQLINAGHSKADIARCLGRDKSTIGKEIKLHRYISHKCTLPIECANYKKCTLGRGKYCSTECLQYAPFKCKRRDSSPGVCNGCSNWCHCRFIKYKYSPERADKEYRATLVDSRQGADLTVSEAQNLASILGPLLKQGLSPYSILQVHPELGICEKTVYNYIKNGVFDSADDITPLDLRRLVSRKISKSVKKLFKKREDRRYLKNRVFKEYEDYIAANPNVFVTQMDTVYNDVSNGPFLQTFKFVKPGIFLALFHEKKSAQTMTDGVSLLESILGEDVFRKYVSVILTDRGSEFAFADAMELSANGSRRTRVFYCDPLQPGQKGSLENKHIELRYILPKNRNWIKLGLTGQHALNLAVSHINSYPLESLGGKSPLEFCEFLYPDLYEKLVAFGVNKIDKDKIILRPSLLKNFQ